METSLTQELPKELLSDLERKFFWWEPVGSQPRSEARILAQAMSMAGFEDVRRLEQMLGYDRLVDIMLRSEPEWINDRSWEFWHGRLTRATGRSLPDAAPARSFVPGPFEPRNLLGAWVVDETDAQALERWGNIVLEFDGSGGLIYTIRGDDKDEIILLRYLVEDSTLITDQPSAPQVERTPFSFAPDGVLTLAFGGVPSRFVRTPNPPIRLKSSSIH